MRLYIYYIDKKFIDFSLYSSKIDSSSGSTAFNFLESQTANLNIGENTTGTAGQIIQIGAPALTTVKCGALAIKKERLIMRQMQQREIFTLETNKRVDQFILEQEVILLEPVILVLGIIQRRQGQLLSEHQP